MATAVTVPGSILATVPNLVAAVQVTDAMSGVDLAPTSKPGAITPKLVSMIVSSLTGSRTRDFLDDFYNRIHVTPLAYAFGTITADTSTTVTIWNAFLRQTATLTDATPPSGSGVTISGANIPFTLAALGSVSYVVTAGLAGSARFNGDVVFGFSGGEEYHVRVSGIRARLWPAAPNWSSSYSITYSFKTEIIISRSGREQRSALRRTPRKSIEFTSTLKLDDLQAAKRLLWNWQQLPFVTPEAPRFTRLSAAVASGDVSIPLADMPYWLAERGMIVLTSGAQSEMLVIESIDAGGITAASATAFDWPEGARVHYGVAGYLTSSLQSSRPTSSAGQISMSFDATPASEAFEEQPDADFTMFDGAPVFLKKPNWSQAPSITSAHDVVEVDFDRGAIARFLPIDFGTESRQATYVGRDFVDAEAIRKLFFRCRGQFKPFWAPTWEFDIPLRAAVPSGNSSLTVAGWDFHDAFADSTVHQAVFVKWADGTVGYRRIASMSAATLDGVAITTITLASAFTRAIDPDADMVGWLYLNRFASDELTIEWLTRAVAQAQITFITVEVEPNLADLS